MTFEVVDNYDWLLESRTRFGSQNSLNPEWEKKVTEYFKDKLKENNATNWVPSLNDVPLHYLKPNSLVKFRCMVQDMFDPEFYMNVYETVDTVTKSRVMHFGKYRDVAECGPHQEIDLNPKQIVTADRQTFYCVPVPGESAWVKEISFIAYYIVDIENSGLICSTNHSFISLVIYGILVYFNSKQSILSILLL
uniref:Mini-chromosome maintenance complex-binding protein n=1 Tax=Laticauda laticaudata TaxID=8630 RepID=A0A8C5SQF5_LATLA